MDLGTILSVARRRWLVLFLALLIGLGLGVARTETTTPTYTSSTAVFFSLTRSTTVGELAQGSTYLQGLVQSYANVATSGLVLIPIADRLGIPGANPLARKVTARPRPNTAILDITVTDSRNQRAAQIADAVATQLTTVVATLSPRASAKVATITVTPISPASVPKSPSAPNGKLNLAIGLVFGIILGVGATVALEVLTAPVTSRESAAAAAGAAVLAMIPYDRRRKRPTLVIREPRSPRAEAFWMLRTNLQLHQPTGESMCLVVTSGKRGEGRTSVAVNLAIAMSHTAHRVLLMDADLRRPAIARMLGLPSTEGVSTVLSGETDLAQALQIWPGLGPADNRLDVLPAGPIPASPSELFASNRADKLLEVLRHRYDVVVIDTPPLLEVADGAVLAAKGDGALLIADSRRTRSKQLAEAVTRLRLAGAVIRGVALNRARPERSGPYGKSPSERPAKPAAAAPTPSTPAPAVLATPAVVPPAPEDAPSASR